MPKYVIERDLPGAGNLTKEQLHGIATKSCTVIAGLGPTINWVHSYVTPDKIYCVYIAPNEEITVNYNSEGNSKASVGFPVA